MKELILKIEQWAEDRNIIKGAKPLDQAMKLFSEFGELADNVGKGRDCRDDIGDVFVVLTIMSKQVNKSLTVQLVELEDLSLKQYVVELGLALNMLTFNADNENDTGEDLTLAVTVLNNIALLCNTTLEECVEIAYNDIKDRKGLMHNGMFIKESDPSYKEALEKLGKV